MDINDKNSCVFPADALILPPSDDRIFKTLLTHPDAKQVLIDVIASAIERTIVDAQVRNTELPVMDVNEKAERFDVNCTIDSGDQIDVEMHSCPQEELRLEPVNFINKYIYYLTDLHSSQESKGKKYYELVRTYQITFCMNTVFPAQSEFVSRFSLRSENGRQLCDQINMVIIELDKLGALLRKPVDRLTTFEKWSLFFKYAPDPLHRTLINDIIINREEIGMAASLLREISKDERERAIQRSRRMAETDRVSDLLTAEARGELKGMAKGELRGRAEGLVEGELKGKAEIIALLKKGLTLEEIENIVN